MDWWEVMFRRGLWGKQLLVKNISYGGSPIWSANYKLKLFVLGVVLWILCNTSNKFAIEVVYPNSPSDVVYIILSYLQRWCVLLNCSDKSEMAVKVRKAGVACAIPGATETITKGGHAVKGI
jgi:hypothetical protein